MPNSIEEESINFVKDYEKKRGRDPKDIRGCGCDIESSGRLIEVKGQSAHKSGRERPRQYWLIFDHRCLNKLLENPERYFIYFVCNLGKTPMLYIIPGKEIITDLDKSLLDDVNRIYEATRKTTLRFEPKCEIHLGKERLEKFRILLS